MAKIGQIIGGRFRITGMIEKGGMSMVYLSEDTHIAKMWVVKETPKMLHGRENALPVFAAKKEAEMIKKLDHPGIVRLVDYFEDDNSVFLVEDYVKGLSLKEYADKSKNLTENEIIDLCEQLCDVLMYLHSGEEPIIFRDIKPENILISDNKKIRLVDFGIARYFNPGKNRDTEYLGTERYAAPEQYEKNGKQTDERTDIFGFGGTAAFLAGCCRMISPGLKQLITKCKETDPEERYQSFGEVLEKLRELRKSANTSSAGRDVSISKILLTVAAVVCICLAISMILLRNGKKHDTLERVNLLIDAIKDDELFSMDEEEQLLDTILPELNEMKERKGFEELAYNIGKLYWFYYDYGSENMAGKNASIPWFTLAKNYNSMAEAYLKIGTFYKNVNIRIRESEDAGMYKELFDDLSELMKKIAPEAESETVSLEVIKDTICALETYARKFRADGIKKDEMLWLLNTAGEAAGRISATSVRSDEIKGDISEKILLADKAIEEAYTD